MIGWTQAGRLARCCTIAILAAAGPAASAEASAPSAVERLTAEHLATPLGLDVTEPRLSWIVESPDRGASQRAYRILVASTPERLAAGEGDVWDSGVVTSSRPYDALYGGPPLESATRYWWKVQAFLRDDDAGRWSAPSWFETGLLKASDWDGADWIGRAPADGAPLNFAGAQWIWHAETAAAAPFAPAEPRYFRRAFSVPAGRSVRSAELIVTADNAYEATLNSKVVARSENITDSWKSAQRVVVVPAAGDNVLAIAAWNLPEANGSNSPAGLLVRLRMRLDDGSTVDVDSSGQWRTSTTAPNGWQTRDFDDSGWGGARVHANAGGGPWGNQVAVPAAAAGTRLDFTGVRWIWHADGTPPAAPPEPRYFRKTFTVTAGEISSAELLSTGDDGYTAWLDGVQVAASSPVTDSWKQAQRQTVTLAPGRHVLAVSTINRPESNGSNSPAGLLARLRIGFADGASQLVETDASWRSAKTAPDDWRTLDFDDSSWTPVAVHAIYGSGPWGANVVVPGSPADAAPLLRREFSVAKPVARARLYVAAGGYASVAINGRPVNDHVLDPTLTTYDKRVEYVAADVTDLLAPGANAIGAELGRGFYGMLTPNVWNWQTAPWHGEPRIRALLRVTYADGTAQTVGTDSAWRLAAGPTLADSLYSGDVYDARRAQKGYDAAGFDDVAWTHADVVPAPSTNLVAQAHQPIRVVDTLPAEAVTSPAPGVHVFRFARNVTGWARLRVQGPAGTEVRLRYGELLDSAGRVKAENSYVSGEFMTDHYTLAGGAVETWEPKFSYKGFQYVEVTGWPGTPTTNDVVARVLHTDLERYGHFESSNALLDTVHELTVDTVYNNLHGIPTDTPVYEKNGWTGDAQVLAELTLSNLDSQAFHAKWLDDLRDSIGGSGEPALIAPSPGWGKDSGAPTWSAAYVMIPWWLYEYRGDEAVLRDHYDAMKRYVEVELGRASNGISNTILADWVSPDSGGGSPPEDPRVSATAYTYLMARTMARIAEVLGRTGDAAALEASAAQVKAAFNTTFLDGARGVYRGDSRDRVYRQSHNALALAFGLVPADLLARVADNLAADVSARGDHLNTGALATKYLLPVLTEHGHGELAYRVATQTTAPSWGFWVSQGATSLWEMWTNPRSVGHAFLGTVDDWFFKDLAGLRVAGRAYERVEVKPHVLGDLTSAEASTRTPFGRVSVTWRRLSGGRLGLDVDVPVGATARVHVPATRAEGITESGRPAASAPGVTAAGGTAYDVGSGAYRFVADPNSVSAPGSVGGTVAPTLSLTLGGPASFGAFTPGVNRTYEASTTANVISSAQDAALTVSDPGSDHPQHLVNGAFFLSQPLQGLGTVKTWTGPVSNDAVTIPFKQAIGANEALRTGSYGKTLTFTLSTTQP